LRTVLCTCGGFYGALVLRQLLTCDGLNILAVIRSKRISEARAGFFEGALGHVRRSGIAYAFYLWFATTVSEWLCVLSCGTRVSVRRGFAGLPVFRTRDINDVDGLHFLTSCAPDLIISAFFNQRLHAAALAVPRRGCLNIHPSLLPAARGVDPVFQSLLHDSPPLGVTVHFMTPELDAGPIVAQRSMGARAGSSVFAATALLFSEGAGLLTAAIERIAGGFAGTPQTGTGSYQGWPTRAELRAFRARGGALVRLADLARLGRGRMDKGW